MIVDLLRSLPQLPCQQYDPLDRNPRYESLPSLIASAHTSTIIPHPGITGNDPGPSSHPRGLPNIERLSAVAMQAAPVKAKATTTGVPNDSGQKAVIARRGGTEKYEWDQWEYFERRWSAGDETKMY